MAKLTNAQKLHLQELNKLKAQREMQVQKELAKRRRGAAFKNVKTTVETVMDKGKPKVKVTEFNPATGKTDVYFRPTDKKLEKLAEKDFKQRGSEWFEGTIEAPKGKAALDTIKFLFGK